MNNLAIVILFAISLCDAHQFVCQLFDGKTKTFEKYCENYDGILSDFCINDELNFVESYRVKRLKIGGCEKNIVIDNLIKFNNISVLDISNSKYGNLHWLRLNLKQLKKLNASHNELSHFWMLLSNATKVTDVDLSYNRLHNIGIEMFGTTKNLVKINLSHNLLESISFDTFMDAKKLQSIDLQSNHFLELPFILHSETLKEIHLQHNPIEHFNYCYLSLMKPTSVYFTWYNIKSFWRSKECHREHLKPIHVVMNNKYEGIKRQIDGTIELHCNDQSFHNLNNFTAGQNTFTNVVNLLQTFGPFVMHMDLSSNHIDKLDANIFTRFDHLITLFLSRTMITDIDISMLHANYLMHLDISFNQLNYINNVTLLENFHSLIILNVSGNHLENVPELIQYLSSSIRCLDLSGNYIGKLNTNAFERLPSLNILNLCNTHLSISDFQPFKQCEHLKVLDISQNRLDGVNFTEISILNRLTSLNVAFCRIKNILNLTKHLGSALRILNLSGNTVHNLNAHIFATIDNLEYLNLSKTNLHTIDNDSFQSQKILKHLDLSKNQLREINFVFVSRYLEFINLEGNELIQIDNFKQIDFNHMKIMAISRNQLSCHFLRNFMTEWKSIQYINNPIDQKHHNECRSSTQGLKDFFNSIYQHIKFW